MEWNYDDWKFYEPANAYDCEDYVHDHNIHNDDYNDNIDGNVEIMMIGVLWASKCRKLNSILSKLLLPNYDDDVDI